MEISRNLITCLAVCLLATSAALTPASTAEKPESEPEGCAGSKTRKVHPLVRELSREDAEGIRRAVIEYYRTGVSEFSGKQETFIGELERGAIFLAEDEPELGTGIGVWEVVVGSSDNLPPLLKGVGSESGYNGLILMRPPALPYGPTEVYVFVHLAEREGVWTVLADDSWEEWFDVD